MGVSVVVNGTTYTIPLTSETGWGAQVTSWIQAVSAGMLQKAGGSFPLTSEVDFGTNYGIKSLYVKSQGTNISSTGVIRLANLEAIGWRNAANSADISLSMNSSNQLTFAGNVIATAVALTSSRAMVTDGSGIPSVSSVTATELGYVSGVTSAIQTQIGTKITTGAAAIVNADVSASAAIVRSKLAAGTASRAVVTDVSGVLSEATTTSTEIGYVNGVTSAIQTQLDSKVAKSTLTAKGDIYVASGSGTVVRQAVGSDNLFLKADSSQTAGVIWSSVANNVSVVAKTANYTATTSDDVITCDSSGGTFSVTLPTAVGNTGKKFTVKKTDSSTTIVTLATTSSQTIDGVTTTTISTQYEIVEVVSDGANWALLSRIYPSAWSNYTPTGSWVSNATYTGKWRRIGDSMHVQVLVNTSGAPTATPLTVSIPSGYTIDTAKILDTSDQKNEFGTSAINKSGVRCYQGHVGYSGTTAVLMKYYDPAASSNSVTQASPNTFASGDSVAALFIVPITNWKG